MIRKTVKNAKIAKIEADRTKKITPLQKRAQKKELRIIDNLGLAQKNSRDPNHTRRSIAAEMGIKASQLSIILCTTSLSRSQATLFQTILLTELLGYRIEIKSKDDSFEDDDINESCEEKLLKCDPVTIIREYREALRHERTTNKFNQTVIRDLKRKNDALKKSMEIREVHQNMN